STDLVFALRPGGDWPELLGEAPIHKSPFGHVVGINGPAPRRSCCEERGAGGWDVLSQRRASLNARRNGMELAAARTTSSDEISTAIHAPRGVVSGRPPTVGTVAIMPASSRTETTPAAMRDHSGPL